MKDLQIYLGGMVFAVFCLLVGLESVIDPVESEIYRLGKHQTLSRDMDRFSGGFCILLAIIISTLLVRRFVNRRKEKRMMDVQHQPGA